MASGTAVGSEDLDDESLIDGEAADQGRGGPSQDSVRVDDSRSEYEVERLIGVGWNLEFFLIEEGQAESGPTAAPSRSTLRRMRTGWVPPPAGAEVKAEVMHRISMKSVIA